MGYAWGTRFFSAGCGLVVALLLSQPATAGVGALPLGAVTAAQTMTGVTTPGCNPTVEAAAQAAAEARVAADRAMIDEVIDQPTSVLAATCMNQAAGVAATQGGNIFSGDFSSDIQPIVGSALASFMGNFDSAIAGIFGSAAGGAISGALSGLFGAGASQMQAEYDCDAMQQTWEAVQTRGVKTGVSAPSLSKLVSGEKPQGAGEKYNKAWDAADKKGVFNNAKSAMNALPRPKVESFSDTDSLCDVLNKIGKGSGCRDVR